MRIKLIYIHVKTVGWGGGGGGTLPFLCLRGGRPCRNFILLYIFPCPPFSINNDLSLTFYSFFPYRPFQNSDCNGCIFTCAVTFDRPILPRYYFLYTVYCDSHFNSTFIYLFIFFLFLSGAITPIMAPSFCLFFLASIFDLCTQNCWKVVLFWLLSRSNDLKIVLDCLYPG